MCGVSLLCLTCTSRFSPPSLHSSLHSTTVTKDGRACDGRQAGHCACASRQVLPLPLSSSLVLIALFPPHAPDSTKRLTRCVYTGILPSYRLLQAALSDPTIVVPGFETSRVMALIAAVLDNSTATPKKQLLRAVRTVYLFDVCNKQGDRARWYLDVKVRISGTRLCASDSGGMR